MESAIYRSAAPAREGLTQRLYRVAGKSAEAVGREFGGMGDSGLPRLGGYICTMNFAGDPMLLVPVGKPLEAKMAGFCKNAKNKCSAMCNRQHDIACVSSWACRNVRSEVYGGGIRFTRFDGFLAFSGFPELIDEAYCCALAQMHELINEEDIRTICRVSKNDPALVQRIMEFILKLP